MRLILAGNGRYHIIGQDSDIPVGNVGHTDRALRYGWYTACGQVVKGLQISGEDAGLHERRNMCPVCSEWLSGREFLVRLVHGRG